MSRQNDMIVSSKMLVARNNENFKKNVQTPSVVNMTHESAYSIIKRYKKLKDKSVYRQKIQLLKIKPPPVKLFCHWFMQLIDCVPIINKETECFILDLMNIPWQYGDEKVVTLFQDFILSLVTSHSYFSFHILESLFKELSPVISDSDSESLKVQPFKLAEEQKIAQLNVLHLIVEISKHVPMCHSALIKIARSSVPYFKSHVHRHSIYTFNLLQLGEFLPEFRKQLLEIIITSMIKLDLHSPKTELEDEEDIDGEMDDDGQMFDMEVDRDEKSLGKASNSQAITSHSVGHTLDTVMILMFRYIHFAVHGGKRNIDIYQLLKDENFVVNGCHAGSFFSPLGSENQMTSGCECNRTKHDNLAAKELYLEVKHIFCQIILPTFTCNHVQFLLFYFLSIRPVLLSDFLDCLRNTYENFNASREERRNAVAYIGSLLSRGNFVAFSHIHSCMELLRHWCASYIDSHGNSYEDIQKHAPFYYVCQVILYSFTFNYKKYTENKSRLKMAESLHLNELVLSSLNPLRYCLPAVAENFSIVARVYQIAYCQTILENNKRVMLPIAADDNNAIFVNPANALEMFFPFDPYLLKRSEFYIKNFYREFDGLPEEDMEDTAAKKCNKDLVVDDSDEEDARVFCMSPKSLKFTFEMSPGFKR